MRPSKSWSLGLLLILAIVVVGEFLVAFHDYVFHRLGISRNLLMSILLVAPLVAAFIATRYSTRHKVAAGLSFLFLYPLIGAAAHWTSGSLGATIDFDGISGALTVFKLHLTMGSLPIIAGSLFGLLFSRERQFDAWTYDED